MNAILLCSEVPKGMKSYGPKSIVPIGKTKIPLIIKQIRHLQKMCEKIYVVIGFDKNKIIDNINDYGLKDNVEFIEHKLFNKTNEAGSFIEAIKTIDNNNYLIVQAGTLMGGIFKQPKTDCIFYIDNTDLLSDINGFNICIRNNNNNASYLFYDTTEKTWTEMLYITTNTLDKFKYLISKELIYDSMFLFECINVAMDNEIVFNTIPVNTKYKKINTHKEAVL